MFVHSLLSPSIIKLSWLPEGMISYSSRAHPKTVKIPQPVRFDQVVENEGAAGSGRAFNASTISTRQSWVVESRGMEREYVRMNS
jgi:hypothetical protein